jgi:hypothetical protein
MLPLYCYTRIVITFVLLVDFFSYLFASLSCLRGPGPMLRVIRITHFCENIKQLSMMWTLKFFCFGVI